MKISNKDLARLEKEREKLHHLMVDSTDKPIPKNKALLNQSQKIDTLINKIQKENK